MKIEFTDFSLRQFSPTFAGTKLPLNKKSLIEYLINNTTDSWFEFKDSYQDFCKYLIIKNDFKEIKAGTIKLNWITKLFVKSGYSSRTPEELPILSRWVKLPFWFKRPKADYLVFVLYSRDQLIKELKDGEILELSQDCEYGIVAILATAECMPDPMPPITIMRNALGINEGGNGVELDKYLYEESVDFWSKNILIK